MDQNVPRRDPDPGVSKLKLAVGAASLFLFIVGLKRTFHMDDARGGIEVSDDPADEPAAPERPAPARP